MWSNWDWGVNATCSHSVKFCIGSSSVNPSEYLSSCNKLEQVSWLFVVYPQRDWDRCRRETSDLTLEWRHNGLDSISNHQPHDCLLNRLFRRRSKKTPKLRVTGLCEGNSPGTGEFPAQMASNAENVSIWWRHHALISVDYDLPSRTRSYGSLLQHSSTAVRAWTSNHSPYLSVGSLNGLQTSNFRWG